MFHVAVFDDNIGVLTGALLFMAVTKAIHSTARWKKSRRAKQKTSCSALAKLIIGRCWMNCTSHERISTHQR
jgi:hypothetical protein